MGVPIRERKTLRRTFQAGAILGKKKKEKEVERKNRNIWIAVIVIIIVCCCCITAVAAGALGWFVTWADTAQIDPEILVLFPRTSEQLEETFQVGESPYLEIRNFAGEVTVRPGQDNTIHVVATKGASKTSSLDRITVSMSEQGDRVVIRTKKASTLSSGYVNLDITAPPGTELDVDTGAGTIDFRDMTGSIRANSGAGEIEARGAAGPVELRVGAGSLRYEGTPAGHCSFETGAGDIRLRLPARPDLRVELSTGLGTVDVDYDVDGTTSPREVRGVIGDGGDASIYAHTGIGNLSVKP